MTAEKVPSMLKADDEVYGTKEHYDESNTYMLLPKKKKDKHHNEHQKKVSDVLSKKRQKKMDKLQQQKIKREKRKENLKDLSNVFIPLEERSNIKSICSVQTSGKRKAFMPPKNKSRFKELDIEAELQPKYAQPDIYSSNLNGSLGDNNSTIIKISQNETRCPTTEKLNKLTSDALPPNTLTNNVSIPSLTFTPIIVARKKTIQNQREILPILGEEHEIMDKIHHNPVVIICGDTGCGKTTQVPQFLYEAGYCTERRIGITEPRRVAAITIAERVAIELNFLQLKTNHLPNNKSNQNNNINKNSNKTKWESDGTVSYQVRYETDVSPKTKIKFMTDGILLKEVQSDFLLLDYSAIIIDEAHERSVYTDILIGLLSRIVLLREKRGIPLKLIIMSATLRVQDFTENKRLFKFEVPILKIPAKQYPITIHYNIKTPLDDYIDETFKKICKIHKCLPPGGILVFVTGRAEVLKLCYMLRQAFPSFKPNKRLKVGNNSNNNVTNIKKDSGPQKSNITSNSQGISVFDSFATIPNTFSSTNPNEINFEESYKAAPKFKKHGKRGTADVRNVDPVSKSLSKMTVLPLYSLLPPREQALVFEYYKDVIVYTPDKNRLDPKTDPNNVVQNSIVSKSENKQSSISLIQSKCPHTKPRLCVIATNVAETSVTIPGIKYVVDAGREKRITYRTKKIASLPNSEQEGGEDLNPVSQTVVDWISKASADQRAGRCGRTGPNGHCYRLYSSAAFNDIFPAFALPEIVDRPCEDIVLQMKLLAIDRISKFPFPTPPPFKAIRHAEALLCALGLLEPYIPNKTNTDEENANTNSLKKSIMGRSTFNDHNQTINGCLVQYNPRMELETLPILLITELGQLVANLPLNPKYGKMIGLILLSSAAKRAHKPLEEFLCYPANLLPYALCIAAALTVRELFTTSSHDQNGNFPIKDIRTLLKDPSTLINAKNNNDGNETNNIEVLPDKKLHELAYEYRLLGDISLIIKAIGATDYMRLNRQYKSIEIFCRTFGIRLKALDEIYKLRRQIYRHIVMASDPFTNKRNKNNNNINNHNNNDNYYNPPDKPKAKKRRKKKRKTNPENVDNNLNPSIDELESKNQKVYQDFTKDDLDILDNDDSDFDNEIEEIGYKSGNASKHIKENTTDLGKIEDSEFLMGLPPTFKQLQFLRRLMVTCSGFNVAKRIDLTPDQRTLLRKRREISRCSNAEQSQRDGVIESFYLCLYDNVISSSSSNNDLIVPAFIHPSSIYGGAAYKNASDQLPDYIVYQEAYMIDRASKNKGSTFDQTLKNEAIETANIPSADTTNLPFPLNLDFTRKIYLKGITTINLNWLPLSCPALVIYDVKEAIKNFNSNINGPVNVSLNQSNLDTYDDDDDKNNNSASLDIFYDAKSGQIKCRAPCTFGPHRWDIGTGLVEYPLSIEKFKYFAKFFLEGKICSALACLTPYLLLTPDTMLKTWANLQTRTQNLLNALITAGIESKADLELIWTVQNNPNFLLNPYLEWVPERMHDRVRSIWPPLTP